MKAPVRLLIEEIANEIKEPVLIVDKEAVIGRQLILSLGKDTKVVFVTKGKPYFPSQYLQNIIYVPFFKKFPTIPDGTYSFLFVISGELKSAKELLPSFIEKAEKDRIPVLFASKLSEMDKDFLTRFAGKSSKLKILLYGDVFDKNLYQGKNSLISKYLYETLAYGKIEVLGNGLSKTYPIYLEDLASAILEAIFGTHPNENIFFAFPKHPPTALSLARAIQKAKPEVKIDFIKEKKEQEENEIPNSGLYLLEDNYPVDARIKEVLLESSVEISSEHLEKYEKQKEESGSKSKKVLLLPFFLTLAAFLLLPFFATLSSSFLGFLSLLKVQADISAGNAAGATNWAEISNNFFSFSNESFSVFYFEANTLGLGEKFLPFGRNIQAGQDISKAALSLSSFYKKISSVLTGKSSSPSKDFAGANLELSNGLVLIRKIEADGSVDKKIISKIKENESLLNFASNISTVLPQLVGVDGKRNYLILFQNNMELRPTGGFIGSYALLSLQKGKITNFTVSDVYDADGQLKGHVEPPFAIRRYLPSEHWYLRDSGFDLDFPKAASTSAFFLRTELGQQVDGVITVDVSFVRDLLKVMGNINVPEYSQTVNADNFFKLAEEHSEKNFFPGSTQKKDFLGAVFRALNQKLLEDKKVSYISLGKAVVQALLTKDILLASDDPSVQGLFTINGWSSSLWDGRNAGAINDFLSINEANLGVNKANFFVERKVFDKISADESGQISGQLSITYQNKSGGNWPPANYKNYLRIVLPAGATLSSVSIDGQTQNTTDAITDPLVYEDKGFVPPKELEVEKTLEDGKEVFGILLNVPANSKKTISYNFLLADRLDFSSSSASYSFKFLKQPGVDSVPFDFSFSYPTSLNAISFSPAVTKQSGSLSFKKDVKSDGEIFLKLTKTQ